MCQVTKASKSILKGVIFSACVLLGLFFNDTTGFAQTSKIMVFGDSLVAGYGLDAEQGFVSQLRHALIKSGFEHEVINAGVSGDTTAGGRARLDWALAEEPDYVIIVLGGNDMLRGLAPEQTRANLDDILARLKDRNIGVLLCGMLAPVNLGREYRDAFDPIFSELAERHQVHLYPFFLEGVALQPELNQPDGLHPNEAGVAHIVASIMPYIHTLLNGSN